MCLGRRPAGKLYVGVLSRKGSISEDGGKDRIKQEPRGGKNTLPLKEELLPLGG